MHRRKFVTTWAVGLTALVPTVASAAPGDVVNKAQASFPLSGETAVVEKVDTGDGLEIRATAADGRAVDLDELFRNERAARRDKFGVLDPALAKHIQRLGDDAVVPVAIWLGEPEQALGERPDEGSSVDDVDKIAQAQSERRAAQVAAVTGPYLERLRQFDKTAQASTSSPLVWATVPVGLIREIANDERIDTISGDLGKGGTETNLSRQVIGGDMAPISGFDGSSVQVGVVESGGVADTSNPFMTVERSDPRPSCGGATAHATGVAGIIGARPGFRWISWFQITSSNLTGVASGARLSVGSWCATGDNRASVDSATTWGARVINNSYFTDTTGTVTANDRHADGIVHNNWRLFVKSAGNRGGGDNRVTSPGNGYNVLSVGNVDLRGTAARGDDVMSGTSSFVDPTSTMSDREKPEVSAPGTNIQMLSSGSPWGGQTNSGTSMAAPMVTGGAARLIQRKPHLGVWPEQLRAILMASAVNNVEGATRLSEVDGAGMVALNRAGNILDSNSHGGQRVDCATFGASQVLSRVELRGEQRLRAAISWTADPGDPDHANRPSSDLDLRVVGPTGTIASSLSFDNTSEIVDVRAPVTGTYEIQVVNFRCARSTFVGFAHLTV